MSRIFLSHSSNDNFEAVALRDWLALEGWQDLFLDLDPIRGIEAGQRWERRLHEAASRCEAVIFLVSAKWLASDWCVKEYMVARRLNKKLFAVLVDPSKSITDLPAALTDTWQVVDLAGGQNIRLFRALLPGSHEEKHVGFSRDGLIRLKRGLQKAGLDPRFFAWPPEGEKQRAPYRGLKPLEAADAGIFFGRDAPIVEATDRLRGLGTGAAPRLMVILGASGAGKSSFLRAGLLPRIARDDTHFVALPPIRPERAALTGENGLLRALEIVCSTRTRAELRNAIMAGAILLRPILAELVQQTFRHTLAEDGATKPPAIVIAIDQAEELFRAEGSGESRDLLDLLRDLTVSDDLVTVIIIFAIRSDNYDDLERAKSLEGLRQDTIPLLPMPRGAYKEVIEGPANRVRKAGGMLTIEPQLTERLLADIESGGGSDALPLLAFTLEQLYLEYHRAGTLRSVDYEAIGGLGGAIDRAVTRAFLRADTDPRIPQDLGAREQLLRRGLIPWLCGIDPDTRSPRRNIARLADIPQEAAPLINLLVEERLLSIDTQHDKNAATGEVLRMPTIEPTHEALLRQWGLLDGWLTEDFAILATFEGLKRASRDWEANDRDKAWLAHQGERLLAVKKILNDKYFAEGLDPTMQKYFDNCQTIENSSKMRRRINRFTINLLFVFVIAGLIGWINQGAIKSEFMYFFIMRPYKEKNISPFVLSKIDEEHLKPFQQFRECIRNCPQMIVLPAGVFFMGSKETERGRSSDESPLHAVAISQAFALSKYDVTFDDWDVCYAVGACPYISDSGFGRAKRPVINVSLADAQLYASWLSQMTGRSYRLPTEAEWEYAARSGSNTSYFFGNDTNLLKDYAWYNNNSGFESHEVGQLKPNLYGFFDIIGNVWQWTSDCYYINYNTDEAKNDTSCKSERRVARGGSWETYVENLRSAKRGWYASDRRAQVLGFRLTRALIEIPAPTH